MKIISNIYFNYLKSNYSTSALTGFDCRRWLTALCLVMGVAACAGRPAVPPAPLPEPVAAVPSLPTILFTIQVGAFSTPERAARYADRLEALGLDAYYFIDTDGLCKVRFERFGTYAEARHRAMALQSQGLIDDFFIVRPRVPGPPDDQQAALRRSIVSTAYRFIGTPYHWAGRPRKPASTAAVWP